MRPNLSACVLPIAALCACSPIEPPEEPEREWPSILQSKSTDPIPVLAAEAELVPSEPIRREATDQWLTDDATLRAELRPLVLVLEEDGALAGWGTGGGVATFDLGLTIEDWDALVAEQGWEIPPYVTLTFVRALTAPALSEAAKEWVKAIGNEPQRTVFQNEGLGQGRIFLEDGCLYVGNPEGVRNLAFFHAETGVDVREEGLVLVDRITGRATGRVGEDFSWAAPNAIREEWDAIKALREACGDAGIVNVGNPEATSVFDARAEKARAEH